MTRNIIFGVIAAAFLVVFTVPTITGWLSTTEIVAPTYNIMSPGGNPTTTQKFAYKKPRPRRHYRSRNLLFGQKSSPITQTSSAYDTVKDWTAMAADVGGSIAPFVALFIWWRGRKKES